MLVVNIHDAKTNLSKYLDNLVNRHEEVIICKNGKPIAKLVEYKVTTERHLGTWKDKVKINADFDELPEDFMKDFK